MQEHISAVARDRRLWMLDVPGGRGRSRAYCVSHWHYLSELSMSALYYGWINRLSALSTYGLYRLSTYLLILWSITDISPLNPCGCADPLLG